MKNKIKQPKMNYSLKMSSTILEVMEILDKQNYEHFIKELKILLEKNDYIDEIDKGIVIMEYLYNNELFCLLACSLMSDIQDLPIFKKSI